MLRALVVVVFTSLSVVAWAQPTDDQLPPPPPDEGATGEPATEADPAGEPAGAPDPAPEATPAVAPTPPDAATSLAAQTTARPKYPGDWRLMVSDLTIIRLNPIGLETRSRIGLQKKLYASDKKVTENNFFFVGAFPKLNPASAQFSLGGEIQPASILNVRTYYELQQFFGTFGFLQSFSSANNANFSDSTLSTLRDDPVRSPQAKLIKHFSVQPMLQLKFGKVAVRSLLQLDYWDFDLRGALVYEPTFDTLLPKQGWTMSTDTDLLYVTGTGLAAGLRHTYVRPFYDDTKHFDDAADAAAYDGQNAHHRLGFFGAYTFKDKGWPATFNKPTAILIVSFYLKHKYRTGTPDMMDAGHTADDYRTRAFPYFIAGFAFESDFLAVRQ